MITKQEAYAVVKKWKKKLLKSLRLEEEKINIHVYKSSSKFLTKQGVKLEGDMGICYPSSIGSDIILFYDKHKNIKELLGTLIHELLHAKVFKLSSLITIKTDVAYEAEEQLVRDLEDFIINMMKYKGTL